jgi:putative ABC transport system permease protein
MSRVLLDTLVTGLPLVASTMGVYMIFRLREDFDLTVDASFTMGGALTAVLLLHGMALPMACVLAVAAAGAMGAVTASLHLALRIPVILAGLVMSIGFYSVNLRVMGTPSLNVVDVPTLFSGYPTLGATQADEVTSLILAGVVLTVLGLLALFLRTELGLALRATGVNARMARSQGVNDRALLVLSLVIANALAGLAGCLLVQDQGFADINMGSGTLIAGVGAVLLGELLLRPTGSKVVRIVACAIVGALLYRLILVVSLRLGLPAEDLQGVTALTLLVAVAAQRYGTLAIGGLRAAVRPPAGSGSGNAMEADAA